MRSKDKLQITFQIDEWPIFGGWTKVNASKLVQRGKSILSDTPSADTDRREDGAPGGHTTNGTAKIVGRSFDHI